MKIRLLIFAPVCLLAYFISVSPAVALEQDEDEYIFGVFPYLSVIRMDMIYAPVADELSKVLQHKVKFRTTSTFNRFLENIKAGYYDFVIIQPFWYPVAVDEKDYIPLARLQEPFVSLVMVLEDSPVSSVGDLRGKVIATPPAFVPVVHMARRALEDHGLRPDEDVLFRAFKSVDSCFQQVLAGKADACVAPPFAPAAFESAMNVKFRTVLESFEIPNLSLVVHPRVPEKTRDRILRSVTSWNSTEQGRALLGGIHTGGFIPVIDEEYDVVRKLVRETGARR